MIYNGLRSVLALLFVLSLTAVSSADNFFVSDQTGSLSTIDPITGATNFIGQDTTFPLATEIEYGLGQLYGDEVNGFTNLHTISTTTGLSTGFVTHGPAAFNGMEFVGNTLYVTNNAGGGTSTLEIVNPNTGAQTLIGATGFGPISGLAWDGNTMWGVTAGGGTGVLVTINLNTGLATPGPTLFDSSSGRQLDHVGSIEFDHTGILYGGMGRSSSFNSGWLFSINTATGASTFVGPTGLAGVTGLTRVPEPASLGVLGLGLCCLLMVRRRS